MNNDMSCRKEEQPGLVYKQLRRMKNEYKMDSWSVAMVIVMKRSQRCMKTKKEKVWKNKNINRESTSIAANR